MPLLLHTLLNVYSVYNSCMFSIYHTLTANMDILLVYNMLDGLDGFLLLPQSVPKVSSPVCGGANPLIEGKVGRSSGW